MPKNFTQKQFDDALADIVANRSRAGYACIRIVALELNRDVVGDCDANRIPMACNAMWKLARKTPHTVVQGTPSRQSSTLEIHYHLDKSAGATRPSVRPKARQAGSPRSRATTFGQVPKQPQR